MLILVANILLAIIIINAVFNKNEDSDFKEEKLKPIRDENVSVEIPNNNVKQTNIEPEDEIIELIKKAIYDGQKLKIKYISPKIEGEKEITVRNILPIKIFDGKELNFIKPLESGQWEENKIYLYAFCELRNEERIFRIDRILKIKTL